MGRRRGHQDHALERVFAARMREAREVNNLRQVDAAPLLGYANSAPLSKLEACLQGRVEAHVLVRASRIYDVSSDFLLGLSDDWERDPLSRDTHSLHLWLLSERSREAARELAAIARLAERLGRVEQGVTELSEAVASLLEALEAFRDRNPGFEDMPASAPVQARAERAGEVAGKVKRLMYILRAGLTGRLAQIEAGGIVVT